MLTEVILEGDLGKEFGREWKLAVSTPQEAVRLITANKPGFARWIRDNLKTYSSYGVLVEHESGETEQLNADNFIIHKKMKRITFYPILVGSGGHMNWTQVLEGAALLVAGWATGGTSLAFLQPALYGMGATMVLQGFISGLTYTPTADQNSFYFNGPTNTTQQGNPVPLVYGQMLVGSQAISVTLQVDKLM